MVKLTTGAVGMAQGVLSTKKEDQPNTGKITEILMTNGPHNMD